MQDLRQLLREISRDRVTDERLGGGQQGAVAGEPGGLAGPQAIGTEMGDLTKSVETAAMRVAGQVVELFELSETVRSTSVPRARLRSGRVAILRWSSSFRNESGE